MDLFTTTTATTTTTTTTTPSPFTTTTTAVVAAVADMYNYYNYTTTTKTTTTAATITATTNIFTTLLNESSFFSNGTSLLPFNDNNTTNTTNNNHDHNHHLAEVFTTPLYALVWVSLTNFLVLVTGVVGNVLVIAVVALVRDMRSPTNLCLVNLSLADLLVLLICQPSAMLEFYEEEKWMLGSFMLSTVGSWQLTWD